MKHFMSRLADHKTPIFIFLCILAVYGLSYYKRQASYTFWMENPGEYVVENVTAMSTLDAYLWLKVARDRDAGKTGKGLRDPLKGYPDLENYAEPNLLVRLIGFSKNLTNGDYHKAGLLLIPLLAGLFVFPLFLYFNTLGFGASAILGGLIGSFSFAYYSRSAMGFVDTDLLNLFFPMAVSALVVLINRERTFRANLLLAAAAGLSMYLFNWWYQQPGFILVYLLFIAVYLLLMRLPWKQAALILLAFALASGPGYLLQSVDALRHFLTAYISPRPTGQIVWPDILQSIQETQTRDFITVLKRLHGFLPVVFVGMAGLLWLYVSRCKQMVPITPLILLGTWSLFGPARFSMYLAPFIGIGIGVLIELLARQAGKKFALRPLATSLLAIALMLTVFSSTISYTAYNDIYGPIISPATTQAFLEIKRIVPKHSAMLTWWDNGYPLMEISEFATFHDNGTHGGMRSTLIAKALTSPHQEEMVALLSSLEEYGFDRLNLLSVQKNLSGEQLVSMAFNHPINMKKDNVYVLYTEDMVRIFGNIFEMGTWDFDKKTSKSMAYALLDYFSQAGNIINFRGGHIDLKRGEIMEGTLAVPLVAALFVKDGHVVDRIDYPADQGVYLQVLVTPGQIPRLQVLEEPVFRSNFNQQFILGNFDGRYFEEVYNNFPVARVLKVKTAGAR